MSHKLRSNLGHLLLHIVLLSIGVIFLLPFVWSVSTSLKPMADLFQVTPNLIPSQIRWANYQDVLDYVPFARIYANTIIVTILRVIGKGCPAGNYDAFSSTGGQAQNRWRSP